MQDAGIEFPRSDAVTMIDQIFRDRLLYYKDQLKEACESDQERVTNLSRRDARDVIAKEKLYADGERYIAIVESLITFWEYFSGLSKGKVKRVKEFKEYSGSLHRRECLKLITRE